MADNNPKDGPRADADTVAPQQATYNVLLRVTNEKTGVSQKHDVLLTAKSQEDAEANAPDEILHDGDDSFEVIETTCFGVIGGGDGE